MDDMLDSTKALIFITFVAYISHLILNAMATRTTPGNKFFPNTVGDISRHFELEMTPAAKTFSIWGVIFSWQLCWMFYCITNTFRSGAEANILSNNFFIAFIFNIALITVWLFTWARKEGFISFIVILLGQISLDIAIASACVDLKDFLDKQTLYDYGYSDVWLQRLLVQNGLLFYGSWTTIATLINFAIVLSYYMGLSTRAASLISLSLLGTLASMWFALENFVFLSYTEYTFTAYIVLMIALIGILLNIISIDRLVGGLSLGLLVLSAMFLIARCIIINLRHHNKFQSFTS